MGAGPSRSVSFRNPEPPAKIIQVLTYLLIYFVYIFALLSEIEFYVYEHL